MAEGAQYGVRARDGFPNVRCLGHIALDDAQVLVVHGYADASELVGVTNEGRHVMALREGLLDEVPAGTPGGAEDGEVHRFRYRLSQERNSRFSARQSARSR